MQISRRRVLTGVGAAAVVASVPGAVLGDDAALLAQVARFHELYATWRGVWAKHLVHRHRRMIHPIGLQAFGNIRIFPIFVNVPNESVH